MQQSSEEQGHDRHLFDCELAFYPSSHDAKKAALTMGVGFGWMPLHLVHEQLRNGS